MSKYNIFSIISALASSNEKKMIISLCILYACCSSGIIGLPLWFEEPKLLCITSKSNNIYIHCTEDEICSNSYDYIIDWERSPTTLVSQLKLFCGKKIWKRIILSMIYFGGFLGCLVNFLIYIRPEKRQKMLAFLGILFSLSNFSIYFFSSSEIMVGLGLGLISFSCMIVNAYGFIIINEYFSGDLAKSATILMTLSWGAFGICFGLFAWTIHSNCKVLFLTMGTIVLVDSLYLLWFKSEKGVKESLSKAPSNVVDFLRELSKLPQVCTNYIIYVLIWTATSITYNDILLELSSLGGNFYINMMMLSGAEIFASFGASIISLKFSISNCLRYFTSVLAMLFACFIFSPIDETQQQNKLNTNILLILMLFGKFLSESVCNLTYVYAPKILTDKFTPYYLVVVRLSSRICLLFLPHINYYLKTFQIHAFVFLAVVWGAARSLQGFTKEIQSDGIEDILNEFKISVMDRLSVISGSSMIHHAPDELLRNFEDGGEKLSMIRERVNHQSLLKTNLNVDLELMGRYKYNSVNETLLRAAKERD